MRRFNLAIITWGVCALARTGESQVLATRQEAEAKVILRIQPTSNREAASDVLDTLSKYLEPRQIKVSVDVPTSDVVRSQCGTATETILLRTSRVAHTSASGKIDSVIITVPPCPRWRQSPVTFLSYGETINGELRDKMGAVGPRTLSKFQALNPGLDSLKANVPFEERTPRAVRLAYSTEYGSWFIKPEYKNAGAEAVLSILSVPGAIEAEIDDGQLTLIPDAGEIDSDGCSVNWDAEKWPFPRSDVLEILQRNRILARAFRRRPPSPTLIGIADTGIDSDEMRLPLDSTYAEAKGSARDDKDGNGFFHDVVGTDIPQRGGFPSYYADYTDHAHGTRVAGLAVGGVGSIALTQEIFQRIKLRILSIVGRTQAPGTVEPVFTYEIRKDAIADALRYQPENKPLSILNISVEASRPIEVFSNALKNSSVLVVMAAGNRGLNLAADPAYPAMYRSDNEQRVLTVAAHGPIAADVFQARLAGGFDVTKTRVLSHFSNWGDKTVDIAAPGCRVNTIGRSGVIETATGTSYAAPLVSFTAGLLMSEGISSAARVRSRILAASDYYPGLRVSSRGVLNIPKALSVYDDLIELRSGVVLRGNVDSSLKVVIGARVLAAHRLLKLTPVSERSARILFLTPGDGVEEETVQLGFASVTFRESDGGIVSVIPLSEIADLVLKAPEFRR